MSVRLVRIAEATALLVPGAPFAAFSGRITGTGRYRPDYVELLAVMAGTGWRLFTRPDGSSAREPLGPGQMYLFRPVDAHELVATPRGALTIRNVAFPFASWERFIAAAELDREWFTRPEPPMIRFEPDDPDFARPFDRALERFWNQPIALDLVEFLAVVVPLFLDSGSTGRGAPRWLRSALAAMNDETELRGGVPRLTELAHVSPAHLWRSTRRYLGLTPTELVNGVQLRHAAFLLSSTEQDIASIGKRCGYASASYFSKTFGSRYGMSPREYRTRSRAGYPAAEVAPLLSPRAIR